MDNLKIPDDGEANLGLRVAVLEMVVGSLVRARENPDGPVPIPFDEKTVQEFRERYGDGSWLAVCELLEHQYGLPVMKL